MNPDFKVKVEKYLKKAKPQLENIKTEIPKNINLQNISEKFIDMVSCYYNDAKHFYDRKEYANALASLEYAEGWYDAGKSIGLFKGN